MSDCKHNKRTDAPPPKPFEATATDGREARISCEPDGMLWVDGASIEELRSILPPGWIEAAQAYRRAVLGMEEAER